MALRKSPFVRRMYIHLCIKLSGASATADWATSCEKAFEAVNS